MAMHSETQLLDDCQGFPVGFFTRDPLPIQAYTDAPASIHIVLSVVDALQVTKYQLEHLLNKDHPGFWRWTTGAERPSPLYLNRMCQLLMMKFLGRIPVHHISWIDWEKSEFHWKNGDVTCENHIPGGSGTIPKEERGYASRLSTLPYQPGRPSSPYSQTNKDIPSDEATEDEYLGRTSKGNRPPPSEGS